MLKSALYGVRCGVVVWFQLFLALFLVHVLNGEFIGWMAGGTCLVLTTLILRPMRYLPFGLSANVITHKFTFGSMALLAFFGTAILTLGALADTLRKVKPVVMSVPGFLCGVMLGFVLTFVYLALEKFKREN